MSDEALSLLRGRIIEDMTMERLQRFKKKQRSERCAATTRQGYIHTIKDKRREIAALLRTMKGLARATR